MTLALFFEGTGQGVHGKKTNVSLVYESCRDDSSEIDESTNRRIDEFQLCHLENGPGAKVGSLFLGGAAGVGWRVIFARARRWFEQNYHRCPPPPAFSTSTKVFLFGFSRGAMLARHFAAWLDKLGVEVAYLGLWDTVDAIPDLSVSEECPANVRRARHAVAEHEARRFFAYVPLKGKQVKEELFPGCHSDVGGLYEDNHVLADIAREWVVAPALEAGLKVEPPLSNLLPSTSNLRQAVRHDSRRLVSNLWGLLGTAKRIFPAAMKRHLTDGNVI